MRTNVFLKDGFLSFYGFCCGYIQKFEIYTAYGFTKEVQMYKEGSCRVYQVKYIDIMKRGNVVQIWETFDTLTDAKKLYFKLIKTNQNENN